MAKQIDCNKFVDVMEIVFPILMGAGFLEGWSQFTRFFPTLLHERDLLRGLAALLFSFSFSLILIRFFFAPSKNLPPLIRYHKNKFWVLAGDVPVMILHSAIYYLICSTFQKAIMEWSAKLLLLYFSTLMLVNAAWLKSIELRLKEDAGKYLAVWRWNNKIHFGIALLAMMLFKSEWIKIPSPAQVLTIIAITLSNSIWDFSLAGDAYFKDPERTN